MTVALAIVVLGLCGWAMAAAIFPKGTVERAERLVFALVFAIAAAALGGLVFGGIFGTGRIAWVCLLLGPALAAGVTAWKRRGAAVGRPSPAGPRCPAALLSALALGAALTIAAAAIAIATHGVHEQQSAQRFASLWAVPVESGPAAGRVEAGVWNHGGPASYRLVVARRGQGPIVERRVRVSPAGRWRHRFGPGISTSQGPLLITLHRGGALYRSVELDTQVPR